MGRFFETLKRVVKRESKEGKGGMKKIAILSIVAVGAISTAGFATFAWITVTTKSPKINAVAGDLNVFVKKVSALKYVYPYYKNTTEFINYDGAGVVKKIVTEDANYSDRNTSTDNVVITLGEEVSHTYQSSGTGTVNNIVYSAEETFKYYLIGDAVFTGEDASTVWSCDHAIAMSNTNAVSTTVCSSVSNVVIPVGAEFSLFDTNKITDSSHANYLTYSSLDSETSRFEITENNTIKCLKTGIYTISYYSDRIEINLYSRNDEAIIGSNILDPTMINLEYYGQADKTLYPTIVDYVPTAVQSQNTMVILDVELAYKNVSEIRAGLNIMRLYNTAGVDYNDGTANLTGYVDEAHRNALRASDFYAYHSLFTATPFDSASAAWTALHKKTNAVDDESVAYFDKFSGEGYTTTCNLRTKEDGDSLIIPPMTADLSTYNPLNDTRVYHCYVAIDYDHTHANYFLHAGRLGKTYMIDRDFGLYFTGTQVLES
ncbi:MAG: hypothetical protein K5694_02550 [Bacilli bacterium]|nr:hypothetical protein [Bacilli bacterium]